MKKSALLILSVVMVLSMVLVASDKNSDEKSTTMKGWVSDEMCGAKGANAGHEACAKKCADAGQKLVFVDDAEKKVMSVANQDALKPHAGRHVEVKASKNSDGSLQVSDVKMLAQNQGAKSEGDAHKH